MSKYRTQLEEWLKGLSVRATCVLDIGGAQGPVKDRVKSWNVNDYAILDLPEFDVEYDNMHEKANIIFCLEVFEYLIRPLEALRNIQMSLKPKGKAYISFPLVYPVHNEIELDALRFTEPGIRRLASAANLKINNIWYRKDESGLLQDLYGFDGMHPAKGFDHSIYGYIVEFEK
jgi:SAM-dependent methyltransferase